MENTLIKLTLNDETKKRAHDSQIARAKENLKLVMAVYLKKWYIYNKHLNIHIYIYIQGDNSLPTKRYEKVLKYVQFVCSQKIVTKFQNPSKRSERGKFLLIIMYTKVAYFTQSDKQLFYYMSI